MKSLWIGVAMVWPFALGQDLDSLTLVRNARPDYTEEARLARLEGRVEIKSKIDKSGAITDLRITQPLGLGLDQKALEAAQQLVGETHPVGPSNVRVDADFILPPESRWHLIGAHFLVPEGVTRPTFATTTYPSGAGITVHAFDEGRLVGAMGRQAYVRLVFDIDDHGVLGNFRVLNASLDIWGDEAIALVSQWRFNPARKGADAVVVPCILDFTWGARDLSIEAVERLRLAMNEPIAGSYQPRPTAIYSPEPPYTAEARAAHLQGTVVISFVVGVDGSPKNLAVAKSLGMGLDESALPTVSTWQFQVPLVNGRPTEIASVVKIDFKLDGK